MSEPAPFAPIFFGPLSYAELVRGEAPSEVVPSEELFWARLSELLGPCGDRGDRGLFELVGGWGAQATPPVIPEGQSGRPQAASFQLRLGLEVSLLRSTGELEEGWIIQGEAAPGQVLLTKDSSLGVLSKVVGLEDLLRQNLFLLPKGMVVRVPRSSGALDADWVIKGIQANRLMVEKLGGGRKQLTPDQFFPFNRDLFVGPEVAESPERKPCVFNLAPGTPIRLKRSTGTWDDSWWIEAQEDDQQVQIVRESELGLVRMKRSLEEIVEQNPQLIPVGIPLRVARSNGSLEDGWFVLEATPEQLLVERPGVGSKTLTIAEILEQNRDRLFGEGSGPSVVPAPEAIAQRLSYAREGRLEGWIWDGFADGGRGATLDANGWPQDSLAEILVVNRLSDVALRAHLAFARELVLESSSERAQALARYVYEHMGGAIAPLESRVALAVFRQRSQVILLGEVPERLGGGLSRHRALLFQILAEEAGLKSSLVRGLVGGACNCPHVWNELELAPGERGLVDLSRAPHVALTLVEQEGFHGYRPATQPGSGGAA